MNKTVVLHLKGDLKQRGFDVTLQIIQHDGTHSVTLDSQLPASPRLSEALIQWQQDYRRLSASTRSLKPYKLRVDGSIHPLENCRESAQNLVRHFRQWLRSDSFWDVEINLRQAVTLSDIVQVLLRTANPEIQSLPWHVWDFVERYPNAEIALSGIGSYPIAKEVKTTSKNSSSVNILAVLGDRQNIDIESDRQMLNQMAGIYIKFLVEPTHQEFNDKLYERAWDILFFAGHSETQAEGQGTLRLNSTVCLTVDEIRYAVRRAVSNGLKLAIFNSCDGLGLAHTLAELQLPYVVVMREAVPDPVAQQFLKYFLTTFAQGNNLHLAEREARERLQGMEKDYPCASWLPIIYQHINASPLQWEHLAGGSLNNPSDFPISDAIADLKNTGESDTSHTPAADVERKNNYGLPVKRLKSLSIAFLCSFVASGVTIGVRSLGLMQNLELSAYDHLMQVRPGQNTPDPRILVVAVSEEDIQYQRNQGMEMEGSLSDDALLMLLQKISPYNPSVVGLDIIHDFPFSPDLQAQLSDQNLTAICRARNSASNLAGVSPPSDIFPENQLGFSNIPLDPDEVIRRQFLGMPSDEICPTQQSFSFRIAQNYLYKQANVSMEWLPESDSQPSQIRLELQIFQRFEKTSGGYSLPSDAAGGYQTLVNYCSANPEQIYLRDILSGSMDSQLSELVRDRIILIGVIKPQVDTHQTPYSNRRSAERMPGVVVHSHMISTVISAALGERSLISWWTEWAENLWILGWSFVGVTVVILWRSPYLRVFGAIAGIIILWGACLMLLVQGWWIPLIPPAIALGLTAAMASMRCVSTAHKAPKSP